MRRRGFSLIELMVASLLATVALVIAAELFIAMFGQAEDQARVIAMADTTIPYVTLFLRDVREGRPLAAYDDLVADKDTVLLRRPELEPDVDRVVIWKIEGRSLVRLLFLNHQESGRREINTNMNLEFIHDFAGSIEMRGSFAGDPSALNRVQISRLAVPRTR